MVTRQGVGVAAIGVALGLAGAVALTRLLASLLFGVPPGDPLTLGAAATSLLIVAALASWWPAHHAASVDPAVSLRSE
jgi:ABC-type antimicrobial peptide transport system permease subunit